MITQANQATFTIEALAPFNFNLTVWALMRRKKSVVDQWDGQTYSRVLVINDEPIKLAVTQGGNQAKPNLQVVIYGKSKVTTDMQAQVKNYVIRMFGPGVNLEPFYKLAKNEPSITQLMKQFKGLKPPRYPNLFEGLVNAVACQQISLDAGIAILGRLIEAYGAKFTDKSGTGYAFPLPKDLLDADEIELKKLGFSYQKARTIRAIAFASASGELEQEELESASNQTSLDTLLKLKGIGRWSAEYVLLRGLGRLDVFPGDDVGGQNNLRQLLKLEVKPSYESIQKLSDAWQPYAGFIYFHLLLQKLDAKGLL